MEKCKQTKYTATDYFGKEFEYYHEVHISTWPYASLKWSYNVFQAKALDGQLYTVHVKGVFNDDNQVYLDSLKTTEKWFVDQLKRSGGIITEEMLKINHYSWVPAAYAPNGRNLEGMTPYAGKQKKKPSEVLDEIYVGGTAFIGKSDNTEWYVTRHERFYELCHPSRGGYGYDTIGFYDRKVTLQMVKLIQQGKFNHAGISTFEFARGL